MKKIFVMLMVLLNVNGWTSPTDQAKQKMNLLKLLESKPLPDVCQVFSSFKKDSISQQLIRDKFINLFDRLIKSDQSDSETISTEHKVLVCLDMFASPTLESFYKNIIDSDYAWLIRQQAIKNLSSLGNYESYWIEQLKKQRIKNNQQLNDSVALKGVNPSDESLKKKSQSVLPELYDALAKLKSQDAIGILCEELTVKYDQHALQALVVINHPKSFDCFKSFMSKPLEIKKSGYNQDQLLDLSMILQFWSEAEPTWFHIEWVVLLDWLILEHPLLQHSAELAIEKQMQKEAELFINALKVTSLKVQRKLLPLLGRSNHPEIVAYLAHLACCSSNEAIKVIAKKEMKIKPKGTASDTANETPKKP